MSRNKKYKKCLQRLNVNNKEKIKNIMQTNIFKLTNFFRLISNLKGKFLKHNVFCFVFRICADHNIFTYSSGSPFLWDLPSSQIFLRSIPSSPYSSDLFLVHHIPQIYSWFTIFLRSIPSSQIFLRSIPGSPYSSDLFLVHHIPQFYSWFTMYSSNLFRVQHISHISSILWSMIFHVVHTKFTGITYFIKMSLKLI